MDADADGGGVQGASSGEAGCAGTRSDDAREREGIRACASLEEELELRERGVERGVASEGREHGVAEAERDGGGVGAGKRGDERCGNGGALEGVARSGEAGEEGVVVVEAKADDARLELGEAARRAAAAEEGGHRRGWPAGGGDDGGGHEGAVRGGEAGEARLDLRDAEGSAAAAEEGGDSREWPAGGGCHPAAAAASRR